jgi:hypothetical protein
MVQSGGGHAAAMSMTSALAAAANTATAAHNADHNVRIRYMYYTLKNGFFSGAPQPKPAYLAQNEMVAQNHIFSHGSQKHLRHLQFKMEDAGTRKRAREEAVVIDVTDDDEDEVAPLGKYACQHFRVHESLRALTNIWWCVDSLQRLFNASLQRVARKNAQVRS